MFPTIFSLGVAELGPLTGNGSGVLNMASAIIAPGTGLGESFLTWNGSQYVAHSCEGGHSDFAPADKRQIRLLAYLLDASITLGVGRACSAIGMPNIYEYLRERADRVVNRVRAIKRERFAFFQWAFSPSAGHPLD